VVERFDWAALSRQAQQLFRGGRRNPRRRRPADVVVT
jgi:hypothetical protein